MKGDKRRIWSKVWTGSIFAAFVAAVSIFKVLLQLEKKVLSEYEKGWVYVAGEEIPKGAFITEQNVDRYLKLQELNADMIPQTAISEREKMIGMVTERSIEKGVFVTEGMFVRENEITKKMTEPVIAGFKAEDLYQVVGGVLRAGDRIHLYTVSESGRTELIWKELFVQQVFDSGGKVIQPEDVTSAAQRINVYMDAQDVQRLYAELAKGTLRVVKVCE